MPKPSANKEAPQHALRRLAKANPQTTPASTSTKLPPWPESGLAQIFGTALPNMSKMLLPPPHHCLGIAFSAKQDKAPRPIDISYLGTKAVMARVQIITQNGPKVWGPRAPPRTAGSVGTTRSVDDFIQRILNLPKRHYLDTIPAHQWIHLVLADPFSFNYHHLILITLISYKS